MIWGSKCHQNNSPVVCNGYVKYEEAEVDRLAAILKTYNCGDGSGGGGPCGIQSAARLGLLNDQYWFSVVLALLGNTYRFIRI